MKVRVIKAFRDHHHQDRVRFEGTIYETDVKRAAQLQKAGVIELLEPMKEYTVEEPEMEKKAGRPKGYTKPSKKTASKVKRIAKSKK